MIDLFDETALYKDRNSLDAAKRSYSQHPQQQQLIDLISIRVLAVMIRILARNLLVFSAILCLDALWRSCCLLFSFSSRDDGDAVSFRLLINS